MELENLKLKKANENTVKISNNLSENVTAMIHTLTEKKGTEKWFTKEEKYLFQSLHYRGPGYFKF